MVRNLYLFVYSKSREIAQERHLLGFTVSYAKVKVDAQDEHVGLEAYFVHGGRRKGDCEANHAK